MNVLLAEFCYLHYQKAYKNHTQLDMYILQRVPFSMKPINKVLADSAVSTAKLKKIHEQSHQCIFEIFTAPIVAPTFEIKSGTQLRLVQKLSTGNIYKYISYRVTS